MSASNDIQSFDAARAQSFADRLVRALNDGALCLMTALGHRAGLFDTLASMPAATSAEIAARAGLNERYVREWLGAMVASGVVEVVPRNGDGDHYRLPAEHAAFLTRAAAADNLAVFSQYIGLLGSVEDDVLACFRHGGGVPYERFPRFHAVMAEDSGQSVLSSLESHVLPLAPELPRRLAGGARLLDLGCGRGRVLNRLAELYPDSWFEGVDLSAEAIEDARREAASRGLANVSFRVADLSDFDQQAEPAAFDVVTTFDAVHDQGQPRRVLAGIHRTLRPDGIYLMQDIRAHSRIADNVAHPLGTLLYTVSCMHCMTVSLAQGGEGLGAMWGQETAEQYLRAAGFRQVEVHRLAHDIQNNWYVVRK
jgi:2-polyprenyl-3-methyl-5-hydroxy-6-metoxy-1,4-benzoquinol methylase